MSVRKAGARSELHVLDYRHGLSPVVLNEEVQTEGYCSEEECKEGRKTFAQRMKEYVARVKEETENLDAP